MEQAHIPAVRRRRMNGRPHAGVRVGAVRTSAHWRVLAWLEDGQDNRSGFGALHDGRRGVDDHRHEDGGDECDPQADHIRRR
jgi:hypothetical protein